MSTERTSGPRWRSVYSVHWMLTYQVGAAADYAKAVQTSWWTDNPPSGERRLICDYAANAVIVVVETIADDVVHAIRSTQPTVSPLSRPRTSRYRRG